MGGNIFGMETSSPKFLAIWSAIPYFSAIYLYWVSAPNLYSRINEFSDSGIWYFLANATLKRYVSDMKINYSVSLGASKPFFGRVISYQFNAFASMMQSLGLKATRAAEIWRPLTKPTKDEWAAKSTLSTALWGGHISRPLWYRLFYVIMLISQHRPISWHLNSDAEKGKKGIISFFRLDVANHSSARKVWRFQLFFDVWQWSWKGLFHDYPPLGSKTRCGKMYVTF